MIRHKDLTQEQLECLMRWLESPLFDPDMTSAEIDAYLDNLDTEELSEAQVDAIVARLKEKRKENNHGHE